MVELRRIALGQPAQLLRLAAQGVGDLLQQAARLIHLGPGPSDGGVDVLPQPAVSGLHPAQPLLHVGLEPLCPLLRLCLDILGPAVGLQLDAGGAILDLLVGLRRLTGPGQLLLGLRQARLRLGQQLLRRGFLPAQLRQLRLQPGRL